MGLHVEVHLGKMCVTVKTLGWIWRVGGKGKLPFFRLMNKLMTSFEEETQVVMTFCFFPSCICQENYCCGLGVPIKFREIRIFMLLLVPFLFLGSGGGGVCFKKVQNAPSVYWQLVRRCFVPTEDEDEWKCALTCLLVHTYTQMQLILSLGHRGGKLQ